MRILLTHRPGGAYAYISDGWMNALKFAGHSVQRWDGQQHIWDQFDPDLYIGCSGHRQPIPEKRRAKIAIHVNPYSKIDIHGINESQNAIDWVIRQRPDVVFGYGHETDRKYWENWEQKANTYWVPMPTAGDLTIYNGNATSTRSYDIGYIGGYWDYKAKNIDKFLLPVLRRSNITLAVYGWGHWPAGICRGQISDDSVADVLKKSKIGPCIAEPHTSLWGIDLPERIFKVALSGALVIHDEVVGIERYMPSVLVGSMPQDFMDLIIKYADEINNEERIKIAAAQKVETLKQHTYFDRMATLLMALCEKAKHDEFGNEALKLLESKMSLIQSQKS